MRARRSAGFILRNAATGEHAESRLHLRVQGGRIAEAAAEADVPLVDLESRCLMPGILNGHDHLDFSTFPPLGQPPYANVYEWARSVDGGAGDPVVNAALAVPLVDRLFLGGIRNLLAGVTAVAHHNSFHRSLARPDFPVRVLEKYEFAHSPGLTPHLRKTYRTTDRRIPWMVHLAEGTDEPSRLEFERLVEENVLRQNTVIIHGIALRADEARRTAEARAALVWCPESNRRLYGATADVATFLAVGVKVGLGSDSPVSGVRDPLSNLAAARAEGVLGDEELLRLATVGTAEAARLPLGGLGAGDEADLLAVTSRDALLAGDRRAVALVVVRGRRLYGEAALMDGVATLPLTVDGASRRIECEMGRRAGGVLKRHPALRRVPWLADVRFGEGD